MNKNTDTDKALAEGRTDNKRSLAIFGGAALVALALAAGPLIAHSVSAANLSNGVMMVRTVDNDGFEGFAGRAGDGSNPGTENPGGGDNGGTDPGTGNPTNPGNGGGDNGGGDGGSGEPTEPPVVVPPRPASAVITITGCTVTNQTPMNNFRSVSLSWTTSREIPAPGLVVEARSGSTYAKVPTNLVRETGRTGSGVVSYTATLTEQDLAALTGNLFGSTTQLVVKEDKDPRIASSDTRYPYPALSVLRNLSIGLMGLNGTCKA
ncbi:hypothetical protein AB0P00_13585 [Microbacterium sp. NPDC077057]|uniref:hypothetical protein n=1 Tax=Microbacterium sp. NPDC077057 TaxID=3154763 RepID=UPI00344650D9